MEKKLKKLFDYQQFEKNPELEKLIAQTCDKYSGELSDDVLSQVNAAGEIPPQSPPEEQGGDRDRDKNSPR